MYCLPRISLLVLLSFSIATFADVPPHSHWQTETLQSQLNATLRAVKSSQEQSRKNSPLSAKQTQAAQSKPVESVSTASRDHIIWVYDAWVTLHQDSDHDDYYSEIELSFDVDTSLNQADIYARIYLGDGFEFREIYTTSDFHIHSDASNDEITLRTRLVEGFRPQEYDLMIEVYDAFSNELQDIYDHTHDDDLFLLPLESNDYETRSSVGGQVAITTEEGGSMSGILLFLTTCLVIFRRTVKF